VTDAVRSGWVSSMGPYVDRFERDFASYVRVPHALSVMNGTVALHLALHGMGIKQGDEVIVPDLTFVAPAHAVLQVGALPVLVDVEPDTWCLDPKAVEKAITPKTRAIIAVHLYGHPADMTALRAIAEGRKLLLIEDCAEAHGAEVSGARVGSLGEVGCFSFYGNKILTTGEGGAITTSNGQLADRLRFLKDHGMSKERRYYHSELAFNYRMTNLQAALGVAQLERAEGLVEARRRAFSWYQSRLGADSRVRLNVERAGYRNSYWMVSAVLGPEVKKSRDQVASELRAKGIDTRPFFVPLSELPHLAGARKVGLTADDCPVARELGSRGLNLPSGGDLEEGDVERVCGALKKIS